MENHKVHNIVLVGFMGTGKSTVGRMLADQLNFTFVDTDEQIEQRAGMSIPDIFEQYGEAYFRDLEQQVVADLMNHRGQVISSGGGAVLRDANREAMLQKGQVIALTADASQIIERVKQDPDRPLLQGNVEERVHLLLEKRKHAYDFADHSIDTSLLPVTDIVNQIVQYHSISNR